MTIRHSGMTIRKGFVLRLICLVIFCGLVVYAVHLYWKIYRYSSRRSYLISKLGEKVSSGVYTMEGEGSVGPPSFALAGSGDGEAVSVVQGAPVVKLESKMVHFDLKGMPPLVEAYKTIFPFLKGIGVTGVLMEYEDMFPYKGKIQGMANKEAYSEEDVRRILGMAKENGLQVIPLVQTFGHFEFVLKLEEYASLREVPKYTQVLCPTNNQSLEIIKEMVDQVMSLHPDVEYLHIGSDEVYYIGQCSACQERMNRFRIDTTDLFLQHVKFVAVYVKDKHKVKPLMWDDEFRNVDEAVITQYGIGDLVEIVVWNYHQDVRKPLPASLWEKYARVFKSVWAGSAFKGADKPNSITANETFYLTNHYSWMSVISEYHSQIQFKGIFLTGWQRYDHFSVLCEIFPVAVPSLVSCMFYLSSNGQPSMEKIFSLASTYLNCGPDMLFCRFPGSPIYNEVLSLVSLQNNMKKLKEQPVFLGWVQSINLQQQFSSPSHVESILQSVVRLRVELDRLHRSLVSALRTMFPEWSVQEWMLTNFSPLAEELIALEESLVKLSKKTTFPVRPLRIPPSKYFSSDTTSKGSGVQDL